ncbi:hypothetical protein pneo_cds_547 [Pandoravirus neocaledonia]|uniref:Uncharacterized protein n=1 Tax=Pandoravirus neocaledonia TaxID=2107708 RepID=A0A2U7UCH7_9VIRU|nr:hypothetical protein pneo_cds_547 [Pandoravirus neocaledonia]AVK76154.1 hypothetical protein pneo_cds_547 [Pandoravirus neocaledonia]
MLPICASPLLSALARLKVLLSAFARLSLVVVFGMDQDIGALAVHLTKEEEPPMRAGRVEDPHADRHCADAPPPPTKGGDIEEDQDHLCARGCGQMILPGKEIRDGRALAAWRDWPFDGHDPAFDRQRDALAAAFAARLEHHVAWIETAPLGVVARERDGAPLSLQHYRYATITAPTTVYTSTVWWAPTTVDEDAFLDDDECDHGDGGDDKEEMGDGDDDDSQGRAGDDDDDLDDRRQRQQHKDDVGATAVASASERPQPPLSIEDAFGSLCTRDRLHGDDQSGSVEHGRGDGSVASRRASGHWQRAGAVDLRTTIVRLCRRGAIVATGTDCLVWRGSIDDVIDQLDAIDGAAEQVHAILCFRPVDVCAGICVPVPH